MSTVTHPLPAWIHLTNPDHEPTRLAAAQSSLLLMQPASETRTHVVGLDTEKGAVTFRVSILTQEVPQLLSSLSRAADRNRLGQAHNIFDVPALARAIVLHDGSIACVPSHAPNPPPPPSGDPKYQNLQNQLRTIAAQLDLVDQREIFLG